MPHAMEMEICSAIFAAVPWIFVSNVTSETYTKTFKKAELDPDLLFCLSYSHHFF